jgi:hypothetical protein
VNIRVPPTNTRARQAGSAKSENDWDKVADEMQKNTNVIKFMK